VFTLQLVLKQEKNAPGAMAMYLIAMIFKVNFLWKWHSLHW